MIDHANRPFNESGPLAAAIEAIREEFPDVQAVYLFGSWGTEGQWPSSDMDIALLLSPERAKALDSLALFDAQARLQAAAGRRVDLVNLRRVSTVFQHEIVTTGRRVYTADTYAADEFDMLTLSFYQKLNEERAGILEEFKKTGKAYPV